MRTIRQWKRLTGEAVQSLALEFFETQKDKALSHLVSSQS